MILWLLFCGDLTILLLGLIIYCLFKLKRKLRHSLRRPPRSDLVQLEFDHYIKGQTCYGLDKLILNNNYADATNMKEAVEDSFMLRNYGTEDGNEALQKKESGGV